MIVKNKQVNSTNYRHLSFPLISPFLPVFTHFCQNYGKIMAKNFGPILTFVQLVREGLINEKYRNWQQ